MCIQAIFHINIMAHARIYDIISCKMVDIIGDISSAINNAVCSIAVLVGLI